ncbi:hypothetical protein Tco_0353913, partial [Tanacetum coccineum]
LLGGHTYDRAEGSLTLQELSVLCTNLSNRVLAMESIKDAQATKISALKSRIKKLEKKCKPSISHHRVCTVFDDQDADHGIEYMEIEEAIDKGRQSGETGGSTKELVSTAVPKIASTARPELSTARPNVDAARQEDSAVK